MYYFYLLIGVKYINNLYYLNIDINLFGYFAKNTKVFKFDFEL